MARDRYPSIRMRILSVLMAFALVPTIFVGFVLYWYTAKQGRQEGMTRVEQTLHGLGEQLIQLTSLVENTASVLAGDHTIRTARLDFLSGTTIGHEIDTYRALSERLAFVKSNDAFINVRLFLPDSALTTHEGLSIFGLTQLASEQVPDAFLSQPGVDLWAPPFSRNLRAYNVRQPSPFSAVTYYYKVKFSGDVAKTGIVIAIDLYESTFLAVLTNTGGIRGRFAILDAQDLLFLETSGDRQGERFEYQISGWTIEAHIPMDQFAPEVASILLIALGTVLLCACVIPLIARATAYRLSKGIDQLVRLNETAITGTYQLIEVDGETREIRRLQQSHNYFVETVRTLIHDVYEEKIARQEAQMTSLYEQMKPHFLYNTLESGKWIALKEKDTVMAAFIEKLAQLLRLSLSKGSDFIPLAQELEHVRLYVDLMNSCSHATVTCAFEVSENARDAQVLRFILQPLVENAIEHGIRTGGRKEGYIAITASLEGGLLTLTVTDDGVGLSRRALEQLNRRESKGVGVQNIINRLTLYYGDRWQIHFMNVNPHGTCVRISIHGEKKEHTA